MDSVHVLKEWKIPQGDIRGRERTTIYGTSYYSFEGIPYGKPPVDSLRFKAPLPAGGWATIRDCSDFIVKPAQKDTEGYIEGVEDCLYLNVYTRKLNIKNKLPVMVWIYGGAFNNGNCSRLKYGPDYFMEEKLILVTFNYRVNVLGFLSLSDPNLHVPGNAGLKDQVLALKWVKNNISAFGGNPQNITVFGESAGGASVHYLLCSDASKNLFHKAICMSGCILNPWAFSEQVTEMSSRLAELKGYSGPKNERNILQYLQSLPLNELLEFDELNKEVRGKGGLYAFVPTKEPYVGEDTILATSRLEALRNAWSNNIPVIIGGNSFEGLIMYPRLQMTPDFLATNFQKFINYLPYEVQQNLSNKPEKLEALAGNLVNEYFDTLQPSAEQLYEHLDYFSYSLFWHGLHRAVRARELYATAATYQYCFNFDSPTFNHHRRMFCGTDITEGVAHADDLGYLFYPTYAWKLNTNTKEYLTIQRMVGMWYAFAYNSNPKCDIMKRIVWGDVKSKGSFKWLDIANQLIFDDMPEDVQKKLKLWNSLYGDKLL